MTDLSPVASLTPVPQLEINTLALGGTGNPMNSQAQALANRDAYRANQIEQIYSDVEDITLFNQSVSRQVLDVSTLRSTPGRFPGEQVQVANYYSDAPGFGSICPIWSDTSTATDDGGSVFAVTGVLVGRWLVAVGDSVNAFAWGAKNSTECSDRLQAMIDWVRIRGWGTVDFGQSSFFLINKPLRGMYDTAYVGKTIIRAQAPFTGVTVDVFGGGTDVISTLIYFIDALPTSPSGTVGTINDPTGARRQNIYIAETITLDCRDIAGYGVFADNYQYYTINCRVKDSLKWGVRINFFGWVGQVASKITNFTEGGLWLGPGCNGINLAGMLAWGETKTPTVSGILVDGDNNGISLSGATVEKVQVGVICRNGTGPVDISGVDFEQCVDHVVYADGAAVAGRVNGPITLSGDFLEVSSPTGSIVRCVNSIVHVTGSRCRNAAKLFDHSGNGYCSEDNNYIDASVLSIGTGVIRRDFRSDRAYVEDFYSPVSSVLAAVRKTHNRAYPYADIVSSGIEFSHQVTSGTNRTMVGRSDWFVENFNLDVAIGKVGLAIESSSASILPQVAGTHNLGTPANKFNRVVANSHVQAAGVGVTVNPLANGEMVMQLTSNTQATIKAMGSDGVVRSANITLA